MPPLISDFALNRANRADLATRFYQMVVISGRLPTGGMNRVELAACSIPALLEMNDHAAEGEHKRKDAYDITGPV